MKIDIEKSGIIIAKNIQKEIENIIVNYSSDKIFILLDENTNKFCLPLIKSSFPSNVQYYEIKSGDKYKSIETAIDIWKFLSENNADRKSLLVNLGGGVITDLGGFVASTFKRGIDFINIPTTLLAQIDAAIGGKTGVNLQGLKNEVGVINSAKKNIIYIDFLKTLTKNHILSGFAEMVKHSLIYSEKEWRNLQKIDLSNIDYEKFEERIIESITIKNNIVQKDPYEKGIREALNFGHTIGHAIESFLNTTENKIQHGEAVAIGMICEIFISNKICTLELEKMFKIVEFLSITFNSYTINIDDYEKIYDFMKHDKKNKNNEIKFSLISDIGKVELNKTCMKKNIFQALNFYFQLKK